MTSRMRAGVAFAGCRRRVAAAPRECAGRRPSQPAVVDAAEDAVGRAGYAGHLEQCHRNAAAAPDELKDKALLTKEEAEEYETPDRRAAGNC